MKFKVIILKVRIFDEKTSSNWTSTFSLALFSGLPKALKHQPEYGEKAGEKSLVYLGGL